PSAARSFPTRRSSDLLTAANASSMVSQFNQAKLPEATSHIWVRITAAAAQVATGCGANSRNGTPSWTTWLAATSTLCNGRGRWRSEEHTSELQSRFDL